jgi:hypothetical protein
MAFTADTLTEDPLGFEALLIAQVFDEWQELGFTFAARSRSALTGRAGDCGPLDAKKGALRLEIGLSLPIISSRTGRVLIATRA